MASDEQETLAEAYRQAQIRVKAQALRDAMVFWQTWDPDNLDETWAATLEAVRDIIQGAYDRSVDLAEAYFQANRELQGLGRLESLPAAVRLSAGRLETSLRVTGPVAWRQAIAAGRNPFEAAEVMQVRQAGAAGRLVQEGGRERVLQLTDADPEATKWYRYTDGNPCAFCAMLAGRGAVYLARGTANFQAHDHCGCTARPGYQNDPDDLARNRQFAKLYDKATTQALKSGELRRGTSNDLLNAFRRAYEG